MKHRILLACSLLLLFSTALHAKRIAVNPNSISQRLDGIYRLVSTGTTKADGTRSKLLGKSLGRDQYAAKQVLSDATRQRFTWSRATGRWGYYAELGRYTAANKTNRESVQNRALRELNRWAERRGAAPVDLSNTAKGAERTLWLYNDEATQTLVTLVSRYSTTLKKTTVILRVEAM